MKHVFVTVPVRQGFKGIFAAGRHFDDGKTGPHAVTDEEYSKLKANPRVAIELATEAEIAAGGPVGPQTSAEALSEEERELLESFRSAQKQRVDVTLVRVSELDQAHSRAGELEAEAKRLSASVKDLEQQVKSSSKGEQELKARIAELESAKVQLEQQVKAAQESKPKK